MLLSRSKTLLADSNMVVYSGDPQGQDTARFEKGMTGSCFCGGITVTINKPDLFSKRNGHLCHCQNCRRASGCVASNFMIVAKEDVQIEDPKGLARTWVLWHSRRGGGN